MKRVKETTLEGVFEAIAEAFKLWLDGDTEAAQGIIDGLPAGQAYLVGELLDDFRNEMAGLDIPF